MTDARGRRPPRCRRAAVSLGLALTLTACAGGQPTRPRSDGPRAIVVATAITDGAVSISPDHLDAGLVKLVITNMTDASQELDVQSTDAGAFHQETAPINPQDMAQLRARLRPGSYTVSVRTPGVRSASLAVRSPPPRRP